jgi:thiol-disulfide isomerase/thioredoxin
MKQFSIIFITAITILSFSSVFGQDQFVLKPAHPKIGDVLSVSYDASIKTAVHKHAKKITCEALILRDKKPPFLVESELKRNGKVWNGNFKLDEPRAQLILFRFRSGDVLDDNNGKSWDKLVYGPDGKAVPGTHSALGMSMMREDYWGFKRTKDLETFKTELNIERELYPNDFNWLSLWSQQLRANPKDSTLKAGIKSEFESIWEKNRNNEEAAIKLISVFNMLGMTAKGDSIWRQRIEANPKGKIAERYRYIETINQPDSLRKADMAEKYFKDFPDGELMNADLLIYYYVKAGLYDKAASFLEHQHITDGSEYNFLAQNLIMKGNRIEQATALAKKGVDLLCHPDPSTKPSYMSKADWKKGTVNELGMALDTYAQGLFRTNRSKEAEGAYKKAVKYTEGKNGDINARLLECYITNGKYKLTMKSAAKFIKDGNSNAKIMEQYKTAYIKSKGSDTGFYKIMGKAKEITENKEKEKITEEKQNIMKELLDKPEIDFTLKDPDGKTVTLSELKGKVVVMDFWATWCGPCKASFPSLQKIYTKYKDNSDVVILALNTWENKTGKELEDLVKGFIADNKYTFCVLYDEGFVEKYGVDGIPTKFVIDKKGMIRFSTIGFEGEQETIAKMCAEIDLLLSDAFYNK